MWVGGELVSRFARTVGVFEFLLDTERKLDSDQRLLGMQIEWFVDLVDGIDVLSDNGGITGAFVPVNLSVVVDELAHGFQKAGRNLLIKVEGLAILRDLGGALSRRGSLAKQVDVHEIVATVLEGPPKYGWEQSKL